MRLTVTLYEIDSDIMWDWQWHYVRLTVTLCEIDSDIMWDWHWHYVRLTVTLCEIDTDIMWDWQWHYVFPYYLERIALRGKPYYDSSITATDPGVFKGPFLLYIL